MDNHEMRKAFINSLPVDLVTSRMNNYIDNPSVYSPSEIVELVRLAVGVLDRLEKELINEDNGSLQN